MDWPDQHHFNAAVGWLELGNMAEARAEFELLTAESRALPDPLAFEWHILAAERRWQEAARIAESWVKVATDAPEAWIQRSFALHEARCTEEAWNKLLPAATLFPDIWTIPYNLACYACQLGQMDAARRWLRSAMLKIEGKRERRAWAAAAQKDDDLKPLWEEIRGGTLG